MKEWGKIKFAVGQRFGGGSEACPVVRHNLKYLHLSDEDREVRKASNQSSEILSSE